MGLNYFTKAKHIYMKLNRIFKKKAKEFIINYFRILLIVMFVSLSHKLNTGKLIICRCFYILIKYQFVVSDHLLQDWILFHNYAANYFVSCTWGCLVPVFIPKQQQNFLKCSYVQFRLGQKVIRVISCWQHNVNGCKSNS